MQIGVVNKVDHYTQHFQKLAVPPGFDTEKCIDGVVLTEAVAQKKIILREPFGK
jgi:hypothetical protein